MEIPAWTVLMAVICVACWPRELPKLPQYTLSSVGIGVTVFVLWVAPDSIWPEYRNLVVFRFAELGSHAPAALAAEHSDTWIWPWRFFRAAVIVPIVEELFWRAWLMRWLIDPRFRNIALGAYAASSFWITAILFASEHGPFWDVGLIAGIVYNAWMVRTKSVADCILMHAVTNAVLSAYVLIGKHWQYWG